ncbi:hypothetical protein FRC01_005076, partial [Tulasnella sp. 417]
MASAEETPIIDIVFRGIDGNECEAFIVAIRDLAFAKGKEEDCHWMLHYATTRLRHKALRWHAKLDPSIRKAWDSFVQALFEEYPLVEDRDEGGIATPVWTSTTFSPAQSTTTLSGNDPHITTVSKPHPAGADRGRAQHSESPSLEPVHSSPLRSHNLPLPGARMGRLLVLYEEDRACYHYVGTSIRLTSNIQDALI